MKSSTVLLFLANITLSVIPAAAETMDQATYRQTLERMNQTAAPLVQRIFRKTFLATGDWAKPRTKKSPGGSFYHPEIPGVPYEDSWGVNMDGWLAREPGFTADAMLFVLCHELGHHVYSGGAEEEADGFAPGCLRWLWTDDDTADWVKSRRDLISAEDREICRATGDRQGFCLRVFSIYRPTEQMRIKAWQGVLSPAEIEQTLTRRRELIRRGVLGKSLADSPLAGGVADLDTCSGAVVRFKNQSWASQALVLTNGHCLHIMKPGEVISHARSTRVIKLYDRFGEPADHEFQVQEIVYGTMTGVDLALYRLEESYLELSSRWNILHFTLGEPPAEQELNVSVPSGRFGKTLQCRLNGRATVREEAWEWPESLRLDHCPLKHGMSGSPMVSALTDEVFGTVNTVYMEGNKACERDAPCEVDKDTGRTSVHPQRTYGSATAVLYTCLNADSEFDLATPGCLLPKP